MKKILLVLSALLLFNCATYNPNYVKHEKRIDNMMGIVFFTGFGIMAGMGIQESMERK